MTSADHEVYSTEPDRPIQQGDIFVYSGIARVALAEDPFVPPAWAAIETVRAVLAQEAEDGQQAAQDLRAGIALVMVVSHDCHLDKELNLVARAAMKADPTLDEDLAYAQAETDDTLDRHVLVSPLVDPAGIPAALDSNTARLLRAGRVVGYYPLPAADGLGLQECVVDLGHRTTVDRLTLRLRLTSLADPARLRLRYALARMDSLRTPDLGAELEAAIGHRITSIERPTGRRTTVALVLDDGSRLELLPRPANTPQTGPRRQRVPARPAP